jgi:hypothetical protein
MANLSNINNKFLVTTGGNVLIGQTSAVGTPIFQVTGNSTFAGNITGVRASFIGTAASGAALVTIENNSGSTATSYGLLVKGGGNSASGKTFEVRDDSGNTDLIVKGNGNVGIGTDVPGYKLDVRADAGSIGQIFVKGGNNPVTSNGEINSEILFGSNDASVQSGNVGGKISSVTEATNGALTGLAFYTYTQTSPGLDEKMRIRYNGDVGIGTSSPGRKLEIKDEITTNGHIQGLRIMGNASNYYDIGRMVSGPLSIQGSQAGYNDIVLAPTSGDVGIGTDSPSAKLEVVTAVGGDAVRLNFGQSADIFLGFNSANPRILLQDNSNVVTHNFQSNGDNYIVGSNVGIGVTGPLSPLTVQANAGGSNLRFVGRSDGISGIDFFNSTQTNGNYFQSNSSWMRARADGGFHFSKGSTPITTDVDGFTIEGMNVGIRTTNPGAELHVVGRVKTTRIVSSNIILGNIRSNVVGTAYLLLVDLNITAGFSLAGKVNAASYTTWNVSDIYVRKNYNAATGVATITGISKSGSTLSVMDISHSSGRFIALKLTGDPEVDVMWAGYRLDDLFQASGEVTTLTSGVIENSVYASY